MSKVKQLKFTAVAVALSLVFSSPVYAIESKGDSRCGYIPTGHDFSVEMTDEDISFDEALDRGVEEKQDGRISIQQITDYEPEGDLQSAYPVGYSNTTDLRTYLSDNFPACRNQSPFGSCWAHSAMALAEFYAVSNLGKSKSINLSEAYLAYGAFKTRTPDFLICKDVIKGSVQSGKNDIDLLDYGGNLEMAAQFLSKNFGYVDESTFPYIKTNSYNSEYFDSEGMLINKMDYLYDTCENNVLHLENMYEVDIKKRPDIVKEAIKRNGIVGCSFYSIDSNYYTTNNAYSDKYNGKPNHAVCTVGWDDNFPSSYFKESVRPDNNGAWLIRNSWGAGTNFSYENYFWMSYETGSLANTVYIYDVTAKADFDNIYCYDTQIHNIASTGYSGPKMNKAANVFKVPEGKQETLTEVTVEFYNDPDYELDIYVNPTDPQKPDSSTNKTSVSGKISFPGLYTIPLSEPVYLSGGDTFSVVVTTDDRFVAYEVDCSSYFSTSGLEAGQSFVYNPNHGGYWEDKCNSGLSGGNFCISAHTKNITTPKETLSASDFAFTPPTSLTYDGQPHAASVVSKGKVVGTITVFYEYTDENGNNEWKADVPVAAGTYRVSVSVTATDKYASAHNLMEDDWVFTITSSGSDPDNPDNPDNPNNPDNPDDPDDPEDPKKDKEAVSDDRIKKIPVRIRGNDRTTEIIYDSTDNTYTTEDGSDVLVISLDGEAHPETPVYYYTGKKLTPGKDGFVVYKGNLYEYKEDYKIGFKKNKNAGPAKAVIRWKKTCDPYYEGKKAEKDFVIAPRSVSANMVDFYVKNGKIKNLTVTDDGITVKPKKKDFIYYFGAESIFIDFMNNFSGSVSVNYIS